MILRILTYLNPSTQGVLPGFSALSPRDHLGRFVAIGRRQQNEGHNHGDQPGEGPADLPQQQAAAL